MSEIVTETKIFRDYLINTSIHGFRFLAEHGRHWTERCIWTIICILSWICTGLLIRSTWDDFQNNAISFVVDTNYLEWDTNFPAVAVCEIDNPDRIATVTDNTFGDPHDYNLDEVVRELVFYHGLSFYTLQMCGPDALAHTTDCHKKNISDFTPLVRSNCPDLFRTCQWNNAQFDCCRYFQRINTEIGWCYIINSIQNGQQSKPVKYPMRSNYKTGPGTLRLELNGHTSVYLLGEQEVPSLTTLAQDVLQIHPQVQYRRFVAVKEIENEAEVKDVSVRQRKCRFDDESNFDVYPYYSYSACCVQCRKDTQWEKCGCVHHLMPNTPPQKYCNITGLDCLGKHYNELTVLKPAWSTRTGLVCDCLPSCTEIELTIIKDEKFGIAVDFAIVDLILERIASQRFKRNVVRGKLDLVVSMGGSTGLFLGASLLSFVEVIYYFTLRIVNNRRIAKKRALENRKYRFEDSSIGIY